MVCKDSKIQKSSVQEEVCAYASKVSWPKSTILRYVVKLSVLKSSAKDQFFGKKNSMIFLPDRFGIYRPVE